jgi:serine/threonine protein phosphatase PrpC
MTTFMPAHNDIPNGRALAFQDNSCHGEDAYVIRELTNQKALDAVLDGATGRGGIEASSYAAGVLCEANVTSVDDLATLLEQVNRELFRRGRGRFFLTTISVALKIGQELNVLSVGDSPALLIRGGDTVPLTPAAKDQPFLGVANALGRHEKLAYKVIHTLLQPQDRLVLVTDGVIENVAPSELMTLVGEAASPEQAVSALQQLLCQKKHANKGRVDDRNSFRHDDATAIFRYFGLDGRPET